MNPLIIYDLLYYYPFPLYSYMDSREKRGYGKNRFTIMANSIFKSCCSCTSLSCVPQMPFEEEES
ncbi:hypothetical protein Ccrd_025182 [Cynara cardunculus var. scolymus]|uniref:Uncharacterized protein n=1 Tax=Cynara cardunculus var. scolymus TaxID=59895 RepID=A0A103XB95_CYNCS|nr:hypothetical protein Ccrd_025182 [Cynara cardunculus var. scolymus]